MLALAEDASLPLLERLKFVAIFANNLDEFFQVRVSGLQEQVEAGVVKRSPDGRTPAEQLEGIRERAQELSTRAANVFATELVPALEKERIRIVRSIEALDPADLAFLEQEFDERIFPVLTPLSVDPAHPFPYISNLSLNLAAMVRDPMTGVRRFARVKVPPLLPRFVPLPDGERFVPLETVIAAHLDRLFPGMELVGHHTFRLTRDADLEVEEDEAEDLLEAIQSVLRRRRRGANPVRLEVDETMSHEVLELLRRELDLEEQEVVVTPGLLDLSALWSLVALDRPELKHEPWVPVTQPRLADGEAAPDLFEVLRAGDILVHHPYDSFSSSVEAFVEQAARDPAVLAIKQTMYRTSTQESPIIRALIRAAELGKQVVALVELKARFDEEANITYARELEQAGVHVVHGVVGLKTHAKISLVVRREAGGVRRYAHVGTGNYNPVTARLYEDIGAPDGRPRDRGRSHRPVQPADRVQPATRVSPAAGGPGVPASGDAGTDPRSGAGGRSDRAEDERARRPRHGGRAVRGVPGGCRDRPDRPRASAACARGSPACPSGSPSARSSAGTSSTRASSGSATETRPPTTSVRPT